MNRRALLLLALLPLAFPQTPAHATLDAITFPTYQEGLPDFNPPFDQFQAVSNLPYVYPYTMRTNLTAKRSSESWRALILENEYLRCVILPDLGGHVQGCFDKLIGRDMFYANGSIKKQWIGLRGAWVAMGLESNFPNGHSWVSVSPVDYAFTDNPDGSASVWGQCRPRDWNAVALRICTAAGGGRTRTACHSREPVECPAAVLLLGERGRRAPQQR